MVEKDEARICLNELDSFKSLEPDGRHPSVLRKLSHVIVRPLSISEVIAIGEVPEGWKKCHSYLQEIGSRTMQIHGKLKE